MALPFENIVGVQQDWANVVTNVAMVDTPFLGWLPVGKAPVQPERLYQTDAFRTPAANVHADGKPVDGAKSAGENRKQLRSLIQYMTKAANVTKLTQDYGNQAGVADELAREMGVEAYEAARLMARLREELVKQRESFVFETVFSDPVGDKLSFLKQAVGAGYTVVLCFIGLSGPETSEQRVAMRVAQGGHDVPSDKLAARFPRTLANLKAAVRDLPHVLVFDNDDLRAPFRRVALFEDGRLVWSAKPMPSWMAGLQTD